MAIQPKNGNQQGVVEFVVVDNTAPGLASVNKSLTDATGKTTASVGALAAGTAEAANKVEGAAKKVASTASTFDKAGTGFASLASKAKASVSPIAGMAKALLDTSNSAEDVGLKVASTAGKMLGLAGAFGIAAGAVVELTVVGIEYLKGLDAQRKAAAALRIEQEISARTSQFVAAEQAKVDAQSKKVDDLGYQKELLEIQGRKNEAVDKEREILVAKQTLAAKISQSGGSTGLEEATTAQLADLRRAEHELELFDARRAAAAVAPTEVVSSSGGRKATDNTTRDLARAIADEAKAQEAINKALAEAVALQDSLVAERSRQDLSATERAIELNQSRLRQEEQGIRATAALRATSARSDSERVAIVAGAEAQLHAVRMRQLAEEHAANENAIAQREAEIGADKDSSPLARLQQQDALKQILHDREVERQNYEMDLARAKGAEEARLAELANVRRTQQLSNIETGVQAFEQLYSEASSFAAFIGQQNAAAQDAELARTVAVLHARGEAQRGAIDREIAGAKGNVALQAELRRKGAKNEQALQAKIEKAEAAHLEKRRRAEARAAGFTLLIDAAKSAANAVTAFASYRYVQGGLLTAAAIFNGIQGASLLAGNIPGGSGGGGGGASGGGGSAGFDRETSAASKTPGSSPSAAKQATNSVGQAAAGGGTTIIIQGGVHTTGAIDEDTAEKIVRATKNLSQSRES